MSIINQKVSHKNLGNGIITEQSDGKITVQFENRAIIMQYPNAFKEFLTATDSVFATTVAEDIAIADKSAVAERKSVFDNAMQNSAQAKIDKAKTKVKKVTKKKA